jgi:CDP-glucose 4,6-dehydratase
MFLDIYKGKTVLITGHAGFVGCWFTLWLKELGAKVIGLSLDPVTEPNLFKIIKIENRIDHVAGDIRDYTHLLSVFKKYKPEIVFHLAAQPLVRLSYKEPRATYETNVMGTVNVLEAIRNAEFVRAGIMVTSDKCYENRGWVFGYREIDAMGGYDPYSSSKGCAELVTSAYRNSFFNPNDYGKVHDVAISSARVGNIIGGGDWMADRIFPDCVRALSQNKKIIIRNPKATRPWQYVLEPLSGYLWLGALMYKDGAAYSGAWNFGPNDNKMLSVEDIVKLVIKHWGDGDYSVDKDSHPHEAAFLSLDCSKAHALLKWIPTYDVYTAIKETVNWYKEYYNSTDKDYMYTFTCNQLKHYIEHAKEKQIEWSVK